MDKELTQQYICYLAGKELAQLYDALENEDMPYTLTVKRLKEKKGNFTRQIIINAEDEEAIAYFAKLVKQCKILTAV